MAIINCPECGKEISDHAVACPYCGYPINKAETIKKATPKKSCTIAYRGGPGSVVGAIIVIALFAIGLLISSIFMLISGIEYFIYFGAVLMAAAVAFFVLVIVYLSYFSRNSSLMGKNCIEYDADKNKLVLNALNGEVIKINFEDYIELKDNFFTDNMLIFTYRTKSGQARKVKLGYCSNRDSIRSNIEKARNQ